ncbi:glucose-1-phosphate thymidylyltransferase RfbA [Gammaproteobacteria bacterium]|nr:glucose-1-phosphate thymidylyltransferase RfbA [Gammaproteobacteria bacterium]
MIGIVLAGGFGSRLFPTTQALSKHLLPIYDKPMIYYPISLLMLAGITDIAFISTSRDLNSYKLLFGNGSDFGLDIEYIVQDFPNGLPEAFILTKDLIPDSGCCLVLGDNILYGNGLSDKLKSIATNNIGSTVLGYQVRDPERFGVVEIDSNGAVISLEEKPQYPKSNIALTGLYFFDKDVSYHAEGLEKSLRGELEIVALMEIYRQLDMFNVDVLGRGYTWLDTGTADSMLEASHFVQTLQHRQGLMVGCLEEISFMSGWISAADVERRAKMLKSTQYGAYLSDLLL